MPSRRFSVAVPLLLVVFFLVAAGGSAARAQGALDVFTIRGVAVDVTAANGNAAKEQALADGQRQAFQQLLERLTAPADRAKLPKADGPDYVRSFSIDNERASSVRYLATLTVRFNPVAVRKLLRDAGVPFTDTRGRPVVVVPVLKAQGRTILWDDPNPWRAAWTALNGGGLVPLLVPPGEVADVQTLSPEQALAADPDRLAAEGARLQAGEVLVAVASLAPDGRRLDVRLSALPGTPKPFDAVAYDLQSGETAEQMMGRAARDVARALDAVYKLDSAQQTDQAEALSAIVPLAGFDDWLAVRAGLARVPQIRSYEVVSLSKTEAALVLHTVGGHDRVKSALADAGLAMDWSDNYWTLHLAAKR